MTHSRKVVLAICRPLFNLLFSWKIEGRENMPLTGPLILVANHVNLVDPFLLLFGLPRWINFVAKEEVFRYALLRFWLRWGGAVPIARNGRVTEKKRILESATDVLGMGLVLGMFPEGARDHDGILRKGKLGSAVIASKAHTPVLPVGIVGTDKIRGASWLWKRPAIVVKIGKPFELPPASGRMSRSQMESLTTELMGKIAALLPSEYQGIYARRAD
jgi:1-acyl-sn-glycerol-3-phosphate acyltransferase